jgi:hypothetical protein
MQPIRRLLLCCLIWLTAASTLLAGVPHFECLCPNGQRKSACLGIVAKGTSCCCGGACCSSGGGCCHKKPQSPVGGARKRSCCQATPQIISKLSGKDVRLHAPGCCKSPAKPKFLGLNLSKTASADPIAAGPQALPVRTSPSGQSRNTDSRLDWLIYCIPPPTNLVIAHRHFLI